MGEVLTATPQERQALGITALLLIAGAGVRIFANPEGSVEYSGGAADTLVVSSLAGVRTGAGEELERENIRSQPLADGERIDPNRADALQLDRLPRVGSALAERIVAWREENGPFRSTADLDRVPGVGPGMLKSLEPHLDLPAAPAGAARQGGAGAGAASGGVNLNRATAAELEVLPGIGPALAARIVASRAEAGRFARIEDLQRVSGIGPALLERLRPLVTVSP